MTELVLENVSKRYGDAVVLDRVDLCVSAGETVAIVGPSGSGKSTLLNIVGSLDSPSSGSVRFGEIDVASLSGAALAAYRASGVGFVFQEHHLLPQLTALENVLLPSLAVRWEVPERRARELLEAVGVAHREAAFPAQMSGGERQRVAIARALLNEPGLVLCDEPTGSLDQETGQSIVALLLHLAAARSTAIVMVTHNLEHASRFSRCLRLRAGRLEES